MHVYIELQVGESSKAYFCPLTLPLFGANLDIEYSQLL